MRLPYGRLHRHDAGAAERVIRLARAVEREDVDAPLQARKAAAVPDLLCTMQPSTD